MAFIVLSLSTFLRLLRKENKQKKQRDLNLWYLVPKQLQDLFSVAVWTFPARFVPVKTLSGALISTVSVRSKSRYGQTCGQKQNRSRQTPQNRGKPPGAFVW